MKGNAYMIVLVEMKHYFYNAVKKEFERGAEVVGLQGIFPSEDVAQLTLSANGLEETAKVIPVVCDKKLGIIVNYGSVYG